MRDGNVTSGKMPPRASKAESGFTGSLNTAGDLKIPEEKLLHHSFSTRRAICRVS